MENLYHVFLPKNEEIYALWYTIGQSIEIACDLIFEE